MRTRRIAAALGLIALVSAADARAQKRNRFESAKHGFAITYPKGWRVIPIKAGEEWILAKFQSQKRYLHNDVQGVTHEHRPLMRVIGFPHKVERKRKVEDGERSITIFSNPYKNYEEYLDRHHQGGGWYISKESEEKVGELAATYREIKVEKLARVPRRIYSLSYHGEDMDYVVEVDVLPTKIGELRSGLLRSLKSLKLILKGPESEQSAAARPRSWVFGKDDAELAKKIAERRRAWRERVRREALATLPPGWKVKEDKDFLVLTHASPKYTEPLVKQARAVRKWLDKKFGDLGEGEVLKTVIRICADEAEARAYVSGSGASFSWDTGEVICAQGAWILSDFASISHALTVQYLSEKNNALWSAMPGWLSGGIQSYIQSGRITKKKGLVFVPDVNALITGRRLLKEKKLFPVQDLFRKTNAQIAEECAGVDESDCWAVRRLFVRYLMEAPEKKTAFIRDYLEQLVQDLDDFEATEWKKVVEERSDTRQPMTEEEEDERFRNYNKRGAEWSKAYEADRRRFLEQAFQHAFGKWTDRDWTKLHRDFTRFIAK